MRHILRAAGAIAALAAAAAQAQSVTPMAYDLAPAGAAAARTVEFWNSQNRPTAIEVIVDRRTLDTAGRAIDTDASADFEVTPQQFLAGSGERQKIRVRYVGPSDIARSESYAISFRQVPLVGNRDEPKLHFLFNLKTLVNVVPVGAEPDIIVGSVVTRGGAAEVTFLNRGNSYGRLDTATLRLATDTGTVEIPAESLREQYDLRWINPGATRRVNIRLDGLAGAPASGEKTSAVQR